MQIDSVASERNLKHLVQRATSCPRVWLETKQSLCKSFLKRHFFFVVTCVVVTSLSDCISELLHMIHGGSKAIDVK